MQSASIYIFEAGGTKTDVLIYSGEGSKTFHSLSGFNPNRNDTNFSTELESLNIPKESVIYFYGSGVKGVKNKERISKLFNSKKISINSDALGASRAILKTNKGIVCILGTGGNVVYFDGTNVIDQKGGYGYLIDDFGGGLELSRMIVSKWLNDGYNCETSVAIEKYFKVRKEIFISHFYQKKDLHYLSGVCKILPKLAERDKVLDQTLTNYFKAFISRHVLPMCEKHDFFEINTVGSISQYYLKWLKVAALAQGITIGKTVSHPIENLLEYHLLIK